MNERREQMSDWMSEQPSTRRVDFVVFQPTVRYMKIQAALAHAFTPLASRKRKPRSNEGDRRRNR